jgi:nucleotide-binding universal stress UspA family protein
MPTLFTNILVGWDGSPGAAAGLRIAVELSASNFGRIVALAAVPSHAHVEDAEERQLAIEEERRPLRAAFEAIIEGSPLATGQQATLEFVEAGDVAGAFDAYEASHRIDLVVVGVHGQEGLLHPRMGHVASEVVQLSRCPVLLVPDADHPPTDVRGSHRSALFHPFRRRNAT